MARSTKYLLGKDINLKEEIVRDLSGRRITDRRVKQIVKGVRRKRAGRASLTKPNVISPEVKARKPILLKKTLDRKAAQRGSAHRNLLEQR
jgi:predicted nucleic acid-binding Zn ribbon protein